MPDIQITSFDSSVLSAYAPPLIGLNGPGLLVLFDKPELTEKSRFFCDELAARGYLVFCPVLFNQALSHDSPFDADSALRNVLSVLAHARKQATCSGKVGVLGFGRGGLLAYLLASRSDIDCAVAFYVLGLKPFFGESRDIRAPLLLHFGEEDPFVPPQDQKAILSSFGRNPVIKTCFYPSVGHDFALPEAPGFNSEIADLAARRSLLFFEEYLGFLQTKP